MRAMPLCRRWFYISFFIVGLCFCLNRTAPAAKPAPAEDKPWLLPENVDKYVFVGKSVWDAEAGKIVSPTGAPPVYGTARRVAGVNDKLFDVPITSPQPVGMAAPGIIEGIDGSSPVMPTLDGKLANDTGSGPGFWASTDHRRVIWLQGGDYWRGEIDWATAKVANRKQVTNLGLFTPLNRPLLWWGHLLFVYGNFDKEKPIVRINLASGETAELETYRAFIVRPEGSLLMSLVSPNGCRVVSATPSVIYCYDVRTGKATMFRNKLEDIPSNRGRQLFVGLAPIWTDDETCYSFDAAGFLARLDFRNSRMDILEEPQIFIDRNAVRTYTKNEGLVPGSHLVDVSRMLSGGKMAHDTPEGRFLLDVTNAQRSALPFDPAATGQWLDDSLFIYTQSKGGISTVGTWLYDRASNSHKRLTGVSIDWARMAVLKAPKQIWAVSQTAGNNLIRMNLDGSSSQNLGPCELSSVRQMPREGNAIDLGLGGATIDLWKPAAVNEAAFAATQPAEPPLGKLKLFELTREASAEEKQFAEFGYDYAATNMFLDNYCDPVKFAMLALAAHKTDPQTPLTNLISKLNLNDAVDRNHLIRYGHNQALEMMRMDQQLSPDQKRDIADRTGPLLADAYEKQPKPDVNKMSLLFQSALASARASVTGQAANPPPAAPAQPAQANAQDTPAAKPAENPKSPPPQQDDRKSRADKAAADRAQKAKQAADRIRGLIGR